MAPGLEPPGPGGLGCGPDRLLEESWTGPGGGDGPGGAEVKCGSHARLTPFAGISHLICSIMGESQRPSMILGRSSPGRGLDRDLNIYLVYPKFTLAD